MQRFPGAACGSAADPGHSVGGVSPSRIRWGTGSDASEIPNETALTAFVFTTDDVPRAAKTPLSVTPEGSVLTSGPAGPVSPFGPVGPCGPGTPSLPSAPGGPCG